MSEKKDELTMTFDPHTIEHLGIKMYSVLPNAMAELIANAYDAEADNVYIKLYDNDSGKKIVVSDDGVGMDFDEINDNFLRIGKKRRESDDGYSINHKRKVSGRKGLGKLAFFGIGDTIEIKTRKNGKEVSFIMCWKDILNCSDAEYKPKFRINDCDDKRTGTEIILSDLKRKSDFDKKALTESLSKLFNFFDQNFNVFITLNDDEPLKIDGKLKYKGLAVQTEWAIPDNAKVCSEYFSKMNIKGKILATEKPLKPGLRGITLYAHGRLANAPEFFGVGESSHGYSYLTGWLDVDFIDEFPEDLISTDRQSLSWDLPETQVLRENLKRLLQNIEQDWRKERKKKREKNISKKTNIDVGNWYSRLPGELKPGVENIVNTIVENSELDNEQQQKVVSTLHDLVPEYTYYHYRHLHETVRDASKDYYQKGDYYNSIEESVKRYVSEVQKKAVLNETDTDLMNKAFGMSDKTKEKLRITAKYKKTDGTNFNQATIENIEEAQKWLSVGLMKGVRNPLAHEEKKELQESGLLTDIDALDYLSLLSHLFKRLENSLKENSK